ncbi:MAG: TVP38/TMEM64 family protein [Candidatus Entotheonellia bacterium]
MINKKKLLLVVVLLAFIGLAIAFRDHLRVESLLAQMRALGPWGPLAFVLLYGIAPPLFVPGLPLTLAGEVLFRPVWGTLYSLVGATGGATLAFFIARYLASDWVERRTKGIVKRLKEGVEQEGWRFVAFTRLVPLFPFNLLNYAFGLTKIKPSHYIVTSFFAMLPGAAAYSFIGYAGRESTGGGEGLVLKIGAALGLLVFIAMLPRFAKRLRGQKA